MANGNWFFLAIGVLSIVDNVLCTDTNDNNDRIVHDPRNEDIGKPQLRADSLIGGVPDKNVKYQAALHNGTDNICGGSIIDDEHILTAAQCVYGAKGPISGPIYVLVGTNILVSSSDSAAIIDKIYIPKAYNGSLGAIQPGDIAVVKLDRKLKIDGNPSIKRVILPKPLFDDIYDLYENKTAVISGYGAEDLDMKLNVDYTLEIKGMTFPTKLLVGKADVLPQKECENAWKEYTKIDQSQLCARMQGQRSRGVCIGDSGGGLVYDGTIIGVISFGNIYCNEGTLGHPAVYTRVTSWISFIKNAMADRIISEDMRSFTVDKVSPSSRTIDNMSFFEHWFNEWLDFWFNIFF